MNSPRGLVCLLMALCLLATLGCNRSAQGNKKRTNARNAPAKNAVAEPSKKIDKPDNNAPASWQVKGWGRTKDEAIEDALRRQARDRVAVHLSKLDPPVTWLPPADELKKFLLVGEAQRVPEEDAQVGGAPAQCWSVQVTLAPDGQRDLVRAAAEERARLDRLQRGERTEERLGVAARALGALVLLLVGVALYIRLDDWAGGAYTRWLRLAVVGAAAAGGAGLWLLA